MTGAFGTGAHPTTRMTLELLLRLEPGAASSTSAAARAWSRSPPPGSAGIRCSPSTSSRGRSRRRRRNAERNGVAVRAVQADLPRGAAPAGPGVAANMPLYVHEHVARELDPARAT